MTYLELKERLPEVFTFLDVIKIFPQEKAETVRMQLHRLVKKERIYSLKRGLYIFPGARIDELKLAGLLYQPSYISLETALNYHGVLPDIPLGITSVTTTTTKKIENSLGRFYFQKIKPELFFGYSSTPFSIATKEKALLDFFYLRRKRNISDLRLNLAGFNHKIYRQYAAQFPPEIAKIKIT